MQVLKSDASPYSKVFLVKGKGGQSGVAQRSAIGWVRGCCICLRFVFSCLVFSVWLSFVLFSLSSRSLLWFLSVWLFAFVALPTIVRAHVGIFFAPCSLSFASSLADLYSRFCFFAPLSRISDYRSLVGLAFNFLPFRFSVFLLLHVLDFELFYLSTCRFSGVSLFQLFDFWSSELSQFFDLTVSLDVCRETLQSRLITRWVNHGLSEDDARVRALGNDMVNVTFVLENSLAADYKLKSKI